MQSFPDDHQAVHTSDEEELPYERWIAEVNEDIELTHIIREDATARIVEIEESDDPCYHNGFYDSITACCHSNIRRCDECLDYFERVRFHFETKLRERQMRSGSQ